MAETVEDVQVLNETTKLCPACQALLSDGTIQNRPVVYCTTCRGLLIGIDKFLPLIEFLRALERPTGSDLQPRGSADADRHFACPICDKPMTAHPYGGPGNVNIDTCEPCSLIWLDHDELQRIVRAPDHYPVYSKYDSGGGLRR
jgi:Zn-finger nucleic acid-binding protein